MDDCNLRDRDIETGEPIDRIKLPNLDQSHITPIRMGESLVDRLQTLLGNFISVTEQGWQSKLGNKSDPVCEAEETHRRSQDKVHKLRARSSELTASLYAVDAQLVLAQAHSSMLAHKASMLRNDHEKLFLEYLISNGHITAVLDLYQQSAAELAIIRDKQEEKSAELSVNTNRKDMLAAELSNVRTSERRIYDELLYVKGKEEKLRNECVRLKSWEEWWTTQLTTSRGTRDGNGINST